MKLSKNDLRIVRDALEVAMEDERKFSDDPDVDSDEYADMMGLLIRVRGELES